MMGTRYRGYLNIPKDDLTITGEVLGTGTTSKVSWSHVQTLFGKIGKGSDKLACPRRVMQSHAVVVYNVDNCLLLWGLNDLIGRIVSIEGVSRC